MQRRPGSASRTRGVPPYGTRGATRGSRNTRYGSDAWSSRQTRNFQSLKISAAKPSTRGSSGYGSRPQSATATSRYRNSSGGSGPQARVMSYSRPVSAPRTRVVARQHPTGGRNVSASGRETAGSGAPSSQRTGSSGSGRQGGVAMSRQKGPVKAFSAAPTQEEDPDDAVANKVAAASAAVAGKPGSSGAATSARTSNGGPNRRTYNGPSNAWGSSDAKTATTSTRKYVRPSSAGSHRYATARSSRPQSARPASAAGAADTSGAQPRGRPSSAASAGTRARQRPGSASRPTSATSRAYGSSYAYGNRRPASAQPAMQPSAKAQAYANAYVQSKYNQKSGQRPSSAAAAYVGGGSGRQAAAALRTGSSHAYTAGGSASLDAEARAQHEWQQRQRLKRVVAAPAFDGRATTDFYKFGKVLGQGSFGKVRLAAHRLSGVRVAIKSYEKAKLQNPSHWRRAQQEIALMERMNHPHIIRMLECIESPKRVHIVMEYAGGGNLCQYVKARRRLAEAEARSIFCQVMLGVEYLHRSGIIHRDVKLENILFDENRQMKLVDFGFSVGCRDPTKKLKIFCGTPSYMAPEIVMRQEYLGRPVDVWSLGVLLYAMLCGVFPFVAKSYPELYKKIIQADLRLPDHLSHSIKDLLQRMLTPDVSKRITLPQVRRHAWIAASAAQALRSLSVPAHHSFMISDDPADDLDERSLKKCEDMCFNRDALTKAVLSRVRNHFTTVYYLVLYRLGRTNVPDHGPVPSAGTPADYARGSARPASAKSSRPAASAAATKVVRPSSAAPTAGRRQAAATGQPGGKTAEQASASSNISGDRGSASESKGQGDASFTAPRSGPVAARHDLGLPRASDGTTAGEDVTAHHASSSSSSTGPVTGWSGVRSSARHPDASGSGSVTMTATSSSTSSSPPSGSATSGAASSVTMSPRHGSELSAKENEGSSGIGKGIASVGGESQSAATAKLLDAMGETPAEPQPEAVAQQ